MNPKYLVLDFNGMVVKKLQRWFVSEPTTAVTAASLPGDTSRLASLRAVRPPRSGKDAPRCPGPASRMTRWGIPTLLCFAVFSGITAAGESSEAPLWKMSFDPSSPQIQGIVSKEGGIQGSYGRFGLEGESDFEEDLPHAVRNTLTLCAWIRARKWLRENDSGFSEHTPPTITVLRDRDNIVRLVFRVRNEILDVAIHDGKRWHSVYGMRRLPAGEWIHVAFTLDAQQARLYVDGLLDADMACPTPGSPMICIGIGRVAQRVFLGDLDEITLWDRALDAARIRELVPLSRQRQAEAFRCPLMHPKRPDYWSRRLTTIPDSWSPLVASLSARCLPFPWFGKGRHDLIAQGVGFNGAPLLFREISPGRYEAGIPVADIVPDGILPGPPSFRLDRADGMADILSAARWQAFDRHLLFFRNIGTPGHPRFAPPVPLLCHGTSFANAYHAALSGVQDVDGDGIVDLLLARSKASAPYLPDAPKSFWCGETLPNCGPGKGYSVNGRWLGYASRHEILWARGQRTNDILSFGPPLPITIGEPDFPLQWKGYGSPRAAWITIGKEAWLIMLGNLDRIMAARVEWRGKDHLHCRDPRDLLRGGARLRWVYYGHAIDVCDLDHDGHPELLISGNPGSLSILRGRRIGDFVEEQALVRGGDLTMQTLIVPCRKDWDGDGIADIIAGDASGWLAWFRGTTDPRRYHPPILLSCNGTPFHTQAGYNGSIQGPNEARWGYVNPTVTDWDEDGIPDLIIGDILDDLRWHRRGKTPRDITPGQAFRLGTGDLPVAWRQRVAVIHSDGSLPRLLYIDWDGKLSLGTPASLGTTDIATTQTLHVVDGAEIKLDGPTGLWGRTKLVVMDWDRDGIWDVVFGTNQSCQRFFSAAFARKESSPFLLRNAGSADRPVFQRPVPIRLGRDDLHFGVHISAIWPSDMDGDGEDDLLVGAEDGRVYVFKRDELTP